MKIKTSAILALTPISIIFKSKISQQLSIDKDCLKIYELGTLRRQSNKDLLITLRSINVDELYLVYEEPNAKNLIPILSCVAAVTSAKRLYILDDKINIKEFKRVKILFSLFSVIWGTLFAHINFLSCYFEMKILLRLTRIDAKLLKHKRVLYTKTNLWYGVQVGGSIGHISGVINSLLNHSYDLTYVSMETPIMLNERVKIHSIPSIKTYGLPQEINLYSFQKHIVRNFNAVPTLCNAEYDFIYSRMAISNYSNVIISRKMNIPLILEYNGSEVWVSEKWGTGIRYKKAAIMAEEICLKHAHLIVVVSQVLKDELISRGIEEKRILFYPNCVDPLKFNPSRFGIDETNKLRGSYNLTEKHKIFTFIGTFGQWHGAEKFAEAIKSMCVNEKEWLKYHKVHFMLIGSGLKMEDVKELIDNPICKDFVTLTGLIPQKDAPLHLAMSNVLVSPHVPNSDGSKFFGSPTKLFEYMAMGKGIIASDLDQIGTVLKNSIHVDSLPTYEPKNTSALSLLVKPGNVSDLIKAIKFLTENEDWAIKLGKNAAIEATNKYTWDIHVSEILSSFKKLFQNT